MYSDAAKVVGADFEVAELTALIERALAASEAQSPSSSVSSSATSNRSATTPVVGDVEDRRAGIRVDGDDQLGRLHPLDVLRRARNPEREVELRRPCAPDFPTWRLRPARVDHRPRRPELGAERVGQLLRDRDVLGAPMPRPTQTIRSAFVRSTPSSGARPARQRRLRPPARPAARAGRARRARRPARLGVQRGGVDREPPPAAARAVACSCPP